MKRGILDERVEWVEQAEQIGGTGEIGLKREGSLKKGGAEGKDKTRAEGRARVTCAEGMS